ncbi:MAG: hypothetical protein Q8N53_07105 [Longimicrobiales bacterium]|nr:hypothetical protein [Longimicrobiales bacterium]
MRTPHGSRRLKALLAEVRRRKIHRTLAIYGAVVWGAIASVPDLFQYLGVPPWGFPALLVTLALGLPVVVTVSWMFDFSLQEEEPSPAEVASVEILTPGDVERVGFFNRRRLLLLVLPVTAVAAVTFGIRRFARRSLDTGTLTVELRTSAGDADVSRRFLQQPLEWLVGASVVGPDAALTSLDEGLRQAREDHARYLITVQPARAGDALTLAVSLYRVDTRERLLFTSGGGATESIEAAMGRIALQLARFLAEREGQELAVDEPVTIMTSSPVALSHFLEGQKRFAATDFDAAVAALRRAIEVDSTFVPAYYWLAMVDQWRWDYATGLRVVDAALALGVSPPRWEQILRAQRLYLLRDVQGALGAYEGVTLHYPELREGWLGLGEALFHYGGFAGHRPEDARQALERALEGESTFAPVGHHLVELAMWNADSATARHDQTLMGEPHSVRPAMTLAFQLRFGAPEERPRVWASLDSYDLRDLSLLVAHFGFDPSAHALADSVANYLLDPSRPPEDRLRGAQYRLMLAADSSDWAARLAIWRSVAGTEEFDPWIVHAHQAGLPVPEAEAMLEWAGQQLAAGRIPDFKLPLNDDLRRAFNALVHEAVIQGDSAAVLDLLSAISAAGVVDPTDPAPEVLAAALRSRLALLAGDTVAAVAALTVATSRTTEPFIAFYPLSTLGPERLLLVRLASATGQQALADRWRSSFFTSLSFGDLIYQSWADELRPSARGGTHPPPGRLP